MNAAVGSGREQHARRNSENFFQSRGEIPRDSRLIILYLTPVKSAPVVRKRKFIAPHRKNTGERPPAGTIGTDSDDFNEFLRYLHGIESGAFEKIIRDDPHP